ncbi:carboxypeptidase-like regulatory domain-containing protein [Gaopeijia maritima]|uniref:Carboxypeptidase-like regulatory domain-containing protein n=1 Tax=Gaopeijia maritima TaxID=3119007 RepID=A0ABU9E8J9_9BACT
MHRSFVFAGLFLLCAFDPLPGQTLVGRVVDDASGAPVIDVEVVLLDSEGEPTGEQRLSGNGGLFRFLDLGPGHYRLSASRLGYRDTTGPFVELQVGDSVEVEFRIAQEAVLLEPLTVTASARPWYEHLKPPALWEFYERSEYLSRIGRGQFLDSEDLAPLQGMPVSMAVATLPGMQAVTSDSSGSRFHLLGRMGCDALFFVNGRQVRLRAPLSRQDPDDVDFVPGPQKLDWFVDDFVSMSEVEAIEVYSGASELPGEFHGFSGGANCGAVVVWTKRGVDRGGEV